MVETFRLEIAVAFQRNRLLKSEHQFASFDN